MCKKCGKCCWKISIICLLFINFVDVTLLNHYSFLWPCLLFYQSQSAPTPEESNSVLQCFRIPSRSNLVGFFSTSQPSSDLVALSQDKSGNQPATPITNLGGCVIVTTTGVYQCRQIVSPEATFLKFVMSSKSHTQGEEFGITYRLDVCGLYQEAAERKLQEGEYKHALKLFELSRVS